MDLPAPVPPMTPMVCPGAVSYTHLISGEVSIALPQDNENLLFRGPDAIVIIGEQPEMARRALEQQVSCLIVCQAELPEDLRQQQTNTCIIATPFDAYKAARMVYYAIEVARVCRREDLEAFHLTDYLDDVREIVLKSRHRSYPILDENDKVVGTLSRYHLIKPRRKRVVLVDHNEAAQSVPGLEQAEILEIIDHHRLADIQTCLLYTSVKGRKLADRPAAEHAQIVRDIADAAFDLRVFIDRQTADRDRPCVRPVDAGQVPDGRGFARAIRADQAVDRPLRHAERQLVQRFFAAEGLCDMGKLDHGVGSSSVSSLSLIHIYYNFAGACGRRPVG